ncbi:MAG: hypothetical protein ACOC4G_06620 [Bacillota bacterium]
MIWKKVSHIKKIYQMKLVVKSGQLMLIILLFIFLPFKGIVCANNIMKQEINYSKGNNIRQVEFRINIIEVEKNLLEKFGLQEISFSSGKRNADYFALKPLSLLNIEAVLASEKSKLVASPTLVCSFNNTGLISMETERIKFDPQLSKKRKFNLEITPEKRSRAGKKIYSRIKLATGSRSKLETSFWSEIGEEKLIGIMKLENRISSSSLFHKINKKNYRFYAVYVEVANTGDFYRGQSIANFDDFELLEVEKSEQVDFNRQIHVLGKNNKRESMFPLYYFANSSHQEWGFDLEVKTFGEKIKMLQGGPDLYYYDNARLLPRVTIKNNNFLEFKIGFEERLELAFFTFRGKYFPLIYDMERNKLNKNGYLAVEGEFRFAPLFLNLQYTGKKDGSPLKIVLGGKVLDNLSFNTLIEGNRRKLHRINLGISYKLWK